MGATQSVSLSTTLDPLPTILQRGLPAVAFFGILSLVTSSGLFLFLTARLIQWYRKGQLHNCNQFWVLLYNLLLADIQQAVAFALTTVWVVTDKVEVGTTTCFANGFFVSTGDLASGVFIFTIALHTFFAVVKGRSVSDKVFYSWLICAWIFVYAMTIITISLHKNVYVRAGAWCWIDNKYVEERLWLHYFWIFVAMFGTVVIYILIYVSINSRLANSTDDSRGELMSTKRAAKYMVIYPVTYVLCTLPLAAGRMASMAGVRIPYWFFIVSGSAITSCGWIDVLLYAVTRRVLVFSADPPPKAAYGLDTFGWHKSSEFYGTATIIEGPLSNSNNFSRRDRSRKLGSMTLRPLKKRHSDEDYFATPAEGVITTKTTIEVHSGPMSGYACSELSMIDGEEKPSSFPHSR